MNASKFYHIQVNTTETKTRSIFYSVKVLVLTLIKTKLCILSYTKKASKPPPLPQQNQNLKNKTIFTILCACKGITNLCFLLISTLSNGSLLRSVQKYEALQFLLKSNSENDTIHWEISETILWLICFLLFF